jgi:hypothetical protein
MIYGASQGDERKLKHIHQISFTFEKPDGDLTITPLLFKEGSAVALWTGSTATVTSSTTAPYDKISRITVDTYPNYHARGFQVGFTCTASYSLKLASILIITSTHGRARTG